MRSRHDIDLYVHEHGPMEGPPLVMLHGIMGHGREWDTATAIWAERFRVLTIDLRGHGLSEWATDYSVEAMTDDVEDIVEDMRLGRVLVAGHSLGGMVGMTLASRRPDLVAALGIIDMAPDAVTPAAGSELAAFIRALADSEYGSVDEALEPWLGNPLARPDLLAHYVRHATREREDGRVVWRFDGNLSRFPVEGISPSALWHAVDRIVAPAMVVRGAHSPFVSESAAREVVSRLSDGHETVIADGGHDLGVEQPELVAAALARLFDQVSAQANSR